MTGNSLVIYFVLRHANILRVPQYKSLVASTLFMHFVDMLLFEGKSLLLYKIRVSL